MKISTLSAAVAVATLLAAGHAAAYSEDVQKKCQGDYLKLCSEHTPGSTGMRKCMEEKGKQLSDQCVNALVDAGEIPKNLRR